MKRSLCVKSLFAVCALSTAMQVSASDSWRDNLKYRSDDGNLKVRLGGRLHVDGAYYDEDVTPLDDDIDVRRGRLGLTGSFNKDWRAKAEYDFAANEDYEWKAVYIGYEGFRHVRIKVGNLQQPFGLEELTSSNNITFMERSLGNAFAPSYHVGATLDSWGKAWTFQLGAFDDTIADIKNNNDGSESVAARFVWRPWKSSGELLHFGVSGQLRDVGSNQRIGVSVRPESDPADRRLLSTSAISGVDRQSLVGAEIAYVHGPFSVQTEYSIMSLDTAGGQDPEFNSWYIQGSWFLTGEHRLYSRKSGTFVGVKPRGSKGALELALRYSQIDLEDANITGGEESNVTLGLNWYINRNSRLMFNAIAASADPNRNGVKDEPNIVQLRYQFVF